MNDTDEYTPSVEKQAYTTQTLICEVGLPTVQQYAQIEEAYFANLTANRRDKALISTKLYEEIKHVLLNPLDTIIKSAQFRFWVRKMFTLYNLPGSSVVLHGSKPVATMDKIYDIVSHFHTETGHGGRDRTNHEVRNNYSWIPKEIVAQFVAACPTCNMRRNGYYLDDDHKRKARKITVKDEEPSSAAPDPGFAPIPSHCPLADITLNTRKDLATVSKQSLRKAAPKRPRSPFCAKQPLFREDPLQAGLRNGTLNRSEDIGSRQYPVEQYFDSAVPAAHGFDTGPVAFGASCFKPPFEAAKDQGVKLEDLAYPHAAFCDISSTMTEATCKGSSQHTRQLSSDESTPTPVNSKRSEPFVHPKSKAEPRSIGEVNSMFYDLLQKTTPPLPEQQGQRGRLEALQPHPFFYQAYFPDPARFQGGRVPPAFCLPPGVPVKRHSNCVSMQQLLQIENKSKSDIPAAAKPHFEPMRLETGSRGVDTQATKNTTSDGSDVSFRQATVPSFATWHSRSDSDSTTSTLSANASSGSLFNLSTSSGSVGDTSTSESKSEFEFGKGFSAQHMSSEGNHTAFTGFGNTAFSSFSVPDSIGKWQLHDLSGTTYGDDFGRFNGLDENDLFESSY